MSSRPTRFRELLLLTGLCGFFFFFRLSGIGLLGPDEPRYAQVAREMLARRDWVTPVLYHHTWLEKPILLYWGEMLSYSAFGVSDWAARVPSALASTLLVFGTFLAVRRIRRPARLDAALMIASSVLILGFARAAATDMLLAAPWGLSLLAWFCWYQANWGSDGPQSASEPRVAHISPPLANAGAGEVEVSPAPRTTRSNDRPAASSPSTAPLCLIAFYALNALAMLAKGPVAPALAAFVLIAFCTTQRNFRAIVRTLHPAGLAVFVAVAAPWYVLVQLHTPEFFRVFFLQHNLARFGSNLYRHRQPFWYYLPVALVATLPWTVWLFHGLADAFTALRSRAPSAGAASVAAYPPAPAAGAASVAAYPPAPAAGAASVAAYPPAPAAGAASVAAYPPAPAAGAASVAAYPPVKPDPAAPAFTFEIFLFLWALVPIAFFSLSRSKLPGYILPSIPALLILAAVAVHRRAARGERPRWPAIAAHAVLLAALAAAGCVAPQLAFKLPLSPASLMLAALAGTAIFLLAALPLLTGGWRFLHFVTLLPVILAVGFILRGLAPAVDATQSSRPLAALIQQIGQPTGLPLATFALSRNTAFGLAFYLNRRVDPYEGLEISPAAYELPPAIPAAAHLLVTRDGSLPALRLLLAGRSLQLLASYAPQRIQIFQVSPAP
jgi:4-amino-4-deoxy-L-arabinose transferase-like glycosyltransferase